MNPESIQAVQEALNKALPGIQMFVRDVNLPQKLVDRYAVGMVILERGFTDASSRIGGMVTSCRYLILSNHMMDVDLVTPKRDERRLHVANRNGRFKVLDIFKHDGKTQITLLHLPDDASWEVFQHSEIKWDGFDPVAITRQRFLTACNAAPIPELAQDDWLSRCAFPLGMDDDGNFFALSP